jgi:hypothetical protein
MILEEARKQPTLRAATASLYAMRWTAPELLRESERRTIMSDVYSFGLTMFG